MKKEKSFKNTEKDLNIILPLLPLIFLILAWSLYRDPEGISFAGKIAGYMLSFLK